ncbi:conserved hypothetical protein [uncultured Desulfobacterium sp.]|uniref:Phage-related replication protein n=1 Tax=uncultured Desulfobacterium sp. TaxID=201089 RepID=A0A445MR26_9BACT|nr:conserved hypothetical protein [uncultured Desulfobacterium sp.]
MGRYKNFSELRTHEEEGMDYEIYVRKGLSGIAVMAPHGGGIEPGTTDIADSVAGNEHTFYCFKGIKPSGNSSLHITSSAFDEPKGIIVAEEADFVITIHGCSGKNDSIYIGGNDQNSIKRLSHELALAGFAVMDKPRPGLEGTKKTNLCNRGRTGRGVQIEISSGLRSKMLKQIDNDILNHNKSFIVFIDILKHFLKNTL